MEIQAIHGFLSGHPLFTCLGENEVSRLAAAAGYVEYQPGDTVTSGPVDGACLSAVVTGKCGAFAHGTGQTLPLRSFGPGDVFGVSGLFSGAPDVSGIRAVTETGILHIPETALMEAVTGNAGFAVAYITFLTQKIVFLNRRIACLGAGSASRKLAAWLSDNIPEGQGPVRLPVSMERLSSMLDMGRASLYRACEDLEAQGLLIRNGKTWEVPDGAALRDLFGL